MRALVTSDEDLDRYNLHNSLAEMVDILDKDKIQVPPLLQLQFMTFRFDDDNPTLQLAACLPLHKQTFVCARTKPDHKDKSDSKMAGGQEYLYGSPLGDNDKTS